MPHCRARLFLYTVGGTKRWFRNLGERPVADDHEKECKAGRHGAPSIAIAREDDAAISCERDPAALADALTAAVEGSVLRAQVAEWYARNPQPRSLESSVRTALTTSLAR